VVWLFAGGGILFRVCFFVGTLKRMRATNLHWK
jgi:hypothetical protein